jgi:hypothetical protein
VAFHNSLDDTNAGITPGYHKSSSVTISSRCQRAHTKAKVTFGLVTPVPKKIAQPLTSNSEKLYLLK